MAIVISLENIDQFIKYHEINSELNQIVNEKDFSKLENYVSDDIDLEKWAWIYFKIISNDHEYTYGPPLSEFWHFVIRDYEEEILGDRSILLKIQKDLEIPKRSFIYLLPEKLKLLYLIKSKKRCFAIETLEGFEFIQGSLQPWKINEIKKIARSAQFVNDPNNLQALVNQGLKITPQVVKTILCCPSPLSFLFLPDEIVGETVERINEKKIKKREILDNLKRWEIHFNVFFSPHTKNDCVICLHNVGRIYHQCRFQHFTCSNCYQKISRSSCSICPCEL